MRMEREDEDGERMRMEKEDEEGERGCGWRERMRI